MITPSADEVARIKAAADENHVDLTNVTFIQAYSQDVMPSIKGPLDFVLVDGGHGFPIPAIDWFYAAQKLNIDGIMMLDDVDLWTGQMIVQFLDAEPAWKREAMLSGRTAVFRLVAPFQASEWIDQPEVVRRSRVPQTMRKARNAATLLSRGDFGSLIRKASHDRQLADKGKGKR